MSPVLMYYLESSHCLLEAVPLSPAKRDKRKCSDGQMEENQVKYAFSSPAFFYTCSGVKKEKEKPSRQYNS